MECEKKSWKAALKAAILVLFISGAVFAVHFTSLGAYLTAERLGSCMNAARCWAPLVFILVYTAGVCVFVPATVFIALGVALFGVFHGFVYSWIASLIGSSLSFYIGRYLGRDFAARLIGCRLEKYDQAIENSGFSTVLYLRLACLPFAPLNYGMGLTKVRFRDFFWGTALGIMVVSFAISLSAGTVKDIWAGGPLDHSLAWKIPSVLALFAVSLSLPKLIKTFRPSGAKLR